MAANERTSEKLAKLASQALRKPETLTKTQIKSLGGALLTQAPDKVKAKPRTAPKRKPS